MRYDHTQSWFELQLRNKHSFSSYLRSKTIQIGNFPKGVFIHILHKRRKCPLSASRNGDARAGVPPPESLLCLARYVGHAVSVPAWTRDQPLLLVRERKGNSERCSPQEHQIWREKKEWTDLLPLKETVETRELLISKQLMLVRSGQNDTFIFQLYAFNVKCT